MGPFNIYGFREGLDFSSIEIGQATLTFTAPHSPTESRTHPFLGNLRTKIHQNKRKIATWVAVSMVPVTLITVAVLRMTEKIKLPADIALMLGFMGVLLLPCIPSIVKSQRLSPQEAFPNLGRSIVAEEETSSRYSSITSLPRYTPRPSSVPTYQVESRPDNLDTPPPAYSLDQRPNSDVGYAPVAVPAASLISNRVRSDNNHPLVAYDAFTLPLLQTQ